MRVIHYNVGSNGFLLEGADLNNIPYTLFQSNLVSATCVTGAVSLGTLLHSTVPLGVSSILDDDTANLVIHFDLLSIFIVYHGFEICQMCMRKNIDILYSIDYISHPPKKYIDK